MSALSLKKNDATPRGAYDDVSFSGETPKLSLSDAEDGNHRITPLLSLGNLMQSDVVPSVK